MVEKLLSPYYIRFKSIFEDPLIFRLSIGLLVALALIPSIFGFDWYIGVVIVFFLLFLWRDYEKDFFVHKENLLEDIFEFVIWIIILVFVLILFKPPFGL